MKTKNILTAIDTATTYKQYKKAFNHLLEKAFQGNTRAMGALDCEYNAGVFLPVDLQKARLSNEKYQAELGKKGKFDAISISNMGMDCKDKGDFKAMIYCFKVAHQKGKLDAALHLAKAYNITGRQSKYVKQLLKTVLYGKGSANNDSKKQAADYLKQMTEGRKKFKPHAVYHSWHKRHYKNRHNTFKSPKWMVAKYAKAITQFEFNEMYKAVKCMRELATRYAYAPAMDFLGTLYCQGIWVSRNVNKSILWYQMALDAGHTDSLLNLARLYRTTFAFDQYHTVLKEAVRLSYPQAQLWLAQLYDAVDRDKKQAKQLLKTLLKNKQAPINMFYEAQELLKQFNRQKK